MSMTKYRHIREELQALQDNINVAVSKLADSSLSAAGVAAGEELVKTLNKVKSYIQKSEDAESVNFIISKLPLLYFQIPKIN
ncbi:MAG TPA: hypothetical protein VLZ29_04470 [Sulfurimonas sp.]|uniref:hypothetical protein n=1 Tax=Sulfurimonas sp. TaxID=2022749 RepID=UPI002B52F502|nr:hypothetical protein [Sulfurimonas sp.]HUH42345.1 hypothetical protein [Sulfurimonas sp.]